MEYPSGLNNPDIRTSPIWVSDIGFAGMPLDMGLFTLPRVPHGWLLREFIIRFTREYREKNRF